MNVDGKTDLMNSVDSVASELPGFRAVVSRREAIGIARHVLGLFPVVAAALCGSFARGEQTAKSDVDFLVSFEPSSRVSDIEDACDALEYALGRDVDLITTLEGQTKSFRDSVSRDGVRIIG